MVLDGLQNILQVGQRRDGTNEIRQALEEAQGIETLQLFVFHENDQISAQSRLILERYIGDPDDATCVAFGRFSLHSLPCRPVCVGRAHVASFVFPLALLSRPHTHPSATGMDEGVSNGEFQLQVNHPAAGGRLDF